MNTVISMYTREAFSSTVGREKDLHKKSVLAVANVCVSYGTGKGWKVHSHEQKKNFADTAKAQLDEYTPSRHRRFHSEYVRTMLARGAHFGDARYASALTASIGCPPEFRHRSMASVSSA